MHFGSPIGFAGHAASNTFHSSDKLFTQARLRGGALWFGRTGILTGRQFFSGIKSDASQGIRILSLEFVDKRKS